MEIKFDYKAKPGLKILKKIDDGKIVWVKGYNGIGKSLAAKILEIISGQHVFNSEKEFESLKDSLLNLIIRLEKDPDIKYRIELTPETWKFDNSMNKIEYVSLGNFFENDELINNIEFAKKFESRTINGNESLPTQILALITHTTNEFNRFYVNSTLFDTFLNQFENKLVDEFELDLIKDFDNLNKNINVNIKKSVDSEKNKKNIENESNILLKIINNYEVLELYEEYDLKELERDLSELENNIINNNKEINNVISRRIKYNDDLKNILDVEESRYNNIIKIFEERKRYIESIIPELYQLSENFDIKFTIQSKKNEIINDINLKFTMLKNNEEMLDELSYQLRLNEDILDKQSRIIFILISKSSDIDIETEIIAEGKLTNINDDINIEVKKLEELINNRKYIIINKLEESSFIDYEKEKELLYEKQKSLEYFQKLLLKKYDADNDLNKLEIEIDSYNKKNLDSYNKIKDNIIDVENKLILLQNNVSTLFRNKHELENILLKFKDVKPKTIIKKEINNLFKQFIKISSFKPKNNINDIKATYQEINKNYILINNQYNILLKNTIDMQKRKEYIINNFKREYEKIQINDNYKFIRNWMDKLDTKNPIQLFQLLNKNLENFTNKIGDTNVNLKIIIDLHDALIKLQTHRPTELKSSPKLIELEEIYNKYLKLFYNTDVFLRYVFEGYKEILNFHLQNNEITLIDNSDNVVQRPFSIFSSGQKAFAFSLAMMSFVLRRESEYKILILDEFGALLDFMREDVLLDQVKNKVLLNNLAQKILILLPVREKLNDKKEELSEKLKYIISEDDKKQISDELIKLNKKINDLENYGYYQEVIL